MRFLAIVTVCATLPFGPVRAAAPAAAEEGIGRLGTTVVPLAETVRLDLDPRQADYSGSVEIALEVKSETPSFRFHAEAINLDHALLARDGSAAPPLALETLPAEDGMVTAHAPGPIPPGRYTLTITFTNDFNTDAVGLYRLKTDGEWYAFTQFEAIDARKAFPCWDEPSFKIPWNLILTVPQEHLAIANTPEERATEKEGKRTVVFRRTRPLPSYLVAIATGPLETVPVPGTSIPTRIVGPKGTARFAAQAVKLTPPLLAALERYFGSRYPYEKLDLIAVPEYWYGAMENPGAITFKDDVLLLDPKSTSDEARKRLAVDVAHELAHMWFGDLVTMRWWDDTWLNESFATWMEVKIVQEVYPEFQVDVDQVAEAQGVMAGDALLSTHAMRQPVRSVASLLQSADGLAYEKGASVLRMTESWLGPAVFRKGVLAYLKAHADGNASGDDLWNALKKASGKDVSGVLSSFLDQAGVPLVRAEPLPGGKVKLTQTRFLNAGTTPPAPQLWKIPVVLAYPKDGAVATRRLLFTTSAAAVKLDVKATPAWIHPNSGEAGYYRWSLPRAPLAALDRDAARVLDPRERTGLLGNAAALLDAGQLEGDAYLEILETFAADPDPAVVAGVVEGLGKVRETFYSEADDPSFSAFVRRVLNPVIDRIGLERRTGESATVSSLRPDILTMLSRDGNDPKVLAEMQRLAAAYLADPAKVDPSLAPTAVAMSALQGDEARFDLYRQRFEKAESPTDRRIFLDALASFRDPALIDRALEYVFTGPLRPQEAMSIPRELNRNPAARGKVWAWMTSHYDVIRGHIPQDFIIFLPYFAYGCSLDRLDAATAFFSTPEHDAPGTSRELAKVSESVRDCARLAGREGPAVRAYVAGHGEGP
jgi:aminopeptidase N